MDKIKLGLFDVFGYLIPGFIFLIALLMFFDFITGFVFMNDFTYNSVQLISKIKTENYLTLFSITVIILSFISGFIVHLISLTWYKNFYLMFCRNIIKPYIEFSIKCIDEFFKSKSQKGFIKTENLFNQIKEKSNTNLKFLLDNSKITTYNVLIRQFSPNQLLFLEEWVSKRAFSYNLSFCFFLLSVDILLFKISVVNESRYYLFLFLSLLFSSFILLRKALHFDTWWRKDMHETVSKFELEKIKFTDFYKN